MTENYYQYLTIKCLFIFNDDREKYFRTSIRRGIRLSCWVNENRTQNTASSVIEVSSDQSQENVFEVVFVLLKPENLGNKFGLGCILSFGAPGQSIGEGKVIEFLGYWDGPVP